MKQLIFLSIIILISNVVTGQKGDINVSFEAPTSYYTVLESDEGVSELSVPIRISKVKDSTIKRNLTLEFSIDTSYSTYGKAYLPVSKIHISAEDINNSDTLIMYAELRVENFESDSSYLIALQLSSDDTSLIEGVMQHILSISAKAKIDYQKLFSKEDTLSIGVLSLTKHADVIVYQRSGGKQNITKESQKEIVNKAKEENNSIPRYYKWRDRRFARKFAPAYNIVEKGEDKGESTLKVSTKSNEEIVLDFSFGKIDIESVLITICDGRLTTIMVNFDDGDYRGSYVSKGPVSLTNFFRKRNYRLHYVGSNPDRLNTFLTLGSFLNYIPTAARHYIPSDTAFEMNARHSSEDLKSNFSPITFFDARIYTDAKGLSGDENGLVQTDLNGRFIANTNALGRSYATLGQYVNVGFTYSKFDSQFDTLQLASLSTRSGNDLLSMVQFANTAFKVEMDIIRGSRVHDAFLSIGHQLFHTKIAADSLFKRVYTPSLYFTLGGTLHAGRMIKADFKLPFHMIYTADQPFTDYNRGVDFILAPEIEIAILLMKDKKEEALEKPFVFGRIKYFDMPDYAGKNFWQLQLGIQVPLTNVFN